MFVGGSSAAILLNSDDKDLAQTLLNGEWSFVYPGGF